MYNKKLWENLNKEEQDKIILMKNIYGKDFMQCCNCKCSRNKCNHRTLIMDAEFFSILCLSWEYNEQSNIF
jgi:hypothetical protein